MAVELNANGYGSGKGSHVSLYLSIMKGPNDYWLQWPYNMSYQLTIVSPTGGLSKSSTIKPTNTGCPHESFERPTSGHNVSCGFAEFLAHTELQQYLKQDNMLITVKIIR